MLQRIHISFLTLILCSLCCQLIIAQGLDYVGLDDTHKGHSDPDVMLDIGGGACSVGAAFHSGLNLHFKRLVVTPNYIGSRTGLFQIFGDTRKFRSVGVLVGWAFPSDENNMLLVASTGFSYNTLVKISRGGLFSSAPDEVRSKYSFGFPLNIKFYVPTRSAIGVYIGARADFNRIDTYTVLILGFKMGRLGHWE